MIIILLFLLQIAEPPAWSQDAVWYQIFVERFHNGDPSNDPTLATMKGSWPHVQPEGWAVTPWTHDWYAQESWATDAKLPFYTAVQLRRYGGDLKGVIDKLPYLADLGITAIYLNPINDAPSLHKFDARHYHHIDVNFGSDPIGDMEAIATEDPADPSTWVWTMADLEFLDLIEKAHRLGIRVVLDVSWNHTGVTFWAWQDVLKNGKASKYADWYEIESFEPFRYRGWAGVRELPEWKKFGAEGRVLGQPVPGNLHPDVVKHIEAVTRRWMDPMGNGSTQYGVDGFRLDVAELIPIGFWRDYRKFVRSINKDAYLVGEVWWETWPEKMLDPGPWLKGDVFDAVMNYRWYKPTRSFFANAQPSVLTASEYVSHLDSVSRGIRPSTQRAMMNLTASHDSERFSTSIQNAENRYKYRMSPHETPGLRIDRPDAWTRKLQRLILIHQFTYIGSPHIWNGDELGMWGADDPDMRKPIIWPELTFDAERAHPFGKVRTTDAVAADLAWRDEYKALIAIRRNHPALSRGGLRYLQTSESIQGLAYARELGTDCVVVVFNNSTAAVDMNVKGAPDGSYSDAINGTPYTISNRSLNLKMDAKSAVILVRRP